MGEQSECENLQAIRNKKSGHGKNLNDRQGADIGGTQDQPRTVKWKVLDVNWDSNSLLEHDVWKEAHRDRSHCSRPGNPKKLHHSSHPIEIDLSNELDDDRDIFKRHAIISRVVGPKFPRKDIRLWVDENWGSHVIVKFLPKGFFMAVFVVVEEKDHILHLQNWFLDIHPLYVQSWTPNFDPTPLAIYDKLVWIQLFNLPTEY
ncbi:hypothetical protein SUGI_1158660 [Cryptomeria japonica]|nr:hypothetical protein SUGI_1158660 [Cryptomeria japonica]